MLHDGHNTVQTPDVMNALHTLQLTVFIPKDNPWILQNENVFVWVTLENVKSQALHPQTTYASSAKLAQKNSFGESFPTNGMLVLGSLPTNPPTSLCAANPPNPSNKPEPYQWV